MKTLVLIIITMFFQTAVAENFNERGMVSAELVKKALANPNRYHFDDGGNIDFGNGFFKRRFNFAGQPQACHEDNMLYAGKSKKCKVISGKYKCDQGKTHMLVTEMTGEKVICSSYGRVNEQENFRCKKPKVIKFNRGPKVKVNIFKSSQMNDHNDSSGLLGYTYLIIPPCNF